ncbi:MAG TPA: putative DNA binding domain-containing protein [Methanocorpusculum sp.]|nr:putative DNA binding domain-containing protein [Methanocorpusculum sp.]
MLTDAEAQKVFDAFLESIVDQTIIETEIIECKSAARSFGDDDLGKYFSALSNEANLANSNSAWLIFGISNNGEIRGTSYLRTQQERNETKKKLADAINEHYTFLTLYELQKNGKRILMMEIPAAPQGIPISFKGHYYARNGESTVPLSIQKIELIRAQNTDWSKAILPEAALDDLDEGAIAFAREKYREKYPALAKEMDNWDTVTFLNKSKITINGKITRAAILLLGKSESDHYISPAQAKIKWILKNDNGIERDYYIATCPFILAVEKIYQKIINLKYRYLQIGTLFPQEVDQYEPYLIREALHNAIAHQNYALNGVINIVQDENTLRVTNLGSFIPGTVENVLRCDAPEERYRNAFLANAMVNYNMVDTIGSGIKKMFNLQAERCFPLPEYTLTENKTEVLFIGKVLDLDYANLLIRNKSLSLPDIILLDKVQKRKELTDEEDEYLRKKKFIRGRKTNRIISSSLAASTGQKVEHSKVKGLTTQGYETVILERLNEYKTLTRNEIDGILENMLPNYFTINQKKNKVNYLLSGLRKKGEIINTGSKTNSRWVLVKDTLKKR